MSYAPVSAHHKRVPRTWLPEEKSVLEATTHAGDFRAVSVELDEICNRDKDTSLGLALTKSIMTDRIDFVSTNAGWNSFRVKPKPADIFRITTLSKLSEGQTSVSYLDPQTSIKTGRKLLRNTNNFRHSKVTISTSARPEPTSLATTQRPYRARTDLSTSSRNKAHPRILDFSADGSLSHADRLPQTAVTLSHIGTPARLSNPIYLQESVTGRRSVKGAGVATSRSFSHRTPEAKNAGSIHTVPFSSFAAPAPPLAPYTRGGHKTTLVPRPPLLAEDDVSIQKEASQILGVVPPPESPSLADKTNFKRQLRAFFVSGLWYDIGRLREADPELRNVPRGLEGRALLRREMFARTRFKEWRVNWSLQAHEESQKKKRAVLRRFNSPESPRKKKNTSKTPVWNKASIDKMTRRKRIIKLCMNFLRTKLTLDMDLVQFDDREIFPRCPYYMQNSKVFFMCIRQSQVEQCSQMLAKSPNLIYQVDDRGRSALHLAVIMRSAVVFDMLLKHKPKLDLEDSQGFRPIDFVLSSNQGYMLKELLVHGAYPFARIYSDRVIRTRVYPSLAFMLESAICLWVGGYFLGMGLRRRRKRYLSELGRVLKGT